MLPLPLTCPASGETSYNKTLLPNSWWWGNMTYNDTKVTTFLQGSKDG